MTLRRILVVDDSAVRRKSLRYALKGACEESLGAGFDAYIAKPVSVSELRKYLHELKQE